VTPSSNIRHFTLAVVVAVLLSVSAAAADKEAVVRGNTEFAFDLYHALRGQDGNLFCSPYSVSTAVAMTYAGARGTTADQMARVLHFTLPPTLLHPAFGDLMQEVNGPQGRSYELYTANALWGQKGYGFQENFIAIAKAHYSAGLNEVDFAGLPEDARTRINQWVTKETHDKITELMPRGVIDAMTRLVLTNAVYFRGDWEQAFDPRRTRDGEFHLSDKTTVNVPFMHHDSPSFRYMRNGDVIALDLPYTGGDLSMILLLPPENRPLSDLEKKLTADNLEAWVRAMKPGRVMVTLPKFKVESQFSLTTALSTLGMPLVFSTKADLSGIGRRKDLYLSDVVHKAYVDVNELGTEAAAATAVVSRLKMGPPAFTANRPFVFLIRDNRSGSVLFLGRVMNPKG
jgi:serpin B